jgi:hypothetical protein
LPDVKNKVRPNTLIRRTEPDDIEEQIKALKHLQMQPAFMAGRLAGKKKNNLPGSWARSLITGIGKLVARLRKIFGATA